MMLGRLNAEKLTYCPHDIMVWRQLSCKSRGCSLAVAAGWGVDERLGRENGRVGVVMLRGASIWRATMFGGCAVTGGRARKPHVGER